MAVDESRSRGVLDLELDAEGVTHDADVEVPVAIEDLARIVGVAAGVEHRERALPEERVKAALSAR